MDDAMGMVFMDRLRYEGKCQHCGLDVYWHYEAKRWVHGGDYVKCQNPVPVVTD